MRGHPEDVPVGRVLAETGKVRKELSQGLADTAGAQPESRAELLPEGDSLLEGSPGSAQCRVQTGVAILHGVARKCLGSAAE
jgi:hypothetical protein